MTVLMRSTGPAVQERPLEARLARQVAAGRRARPRLAAVVVRVGAGPDPGPPTDIVDQWGEQSFPASDPPANW